MQEHQKSQLILMKKSVNQPRISCATKITQNYPVIPLDSADLSASFWNQITSKTEGRKLIQKNTYQNKIKHIHCKKNNAKN